MKIKRKPVMASRSYGDDTVFVIFRKVRADGQWVPCAFWYSSGQTLNYGRLYVIEPEFNGYVCEEVDMSYYNASRKLTPEDPGYDDLKSYTYDFLSDHGDGQGGFKNIVERQRVDYNALRNSWYRDTIPDEDYVEYSVRSSTTAEKRPIKAAAEGHDPWSLIEQDREKVIKEWSETYDGTPTTSWDNIFDNVLEDFKRYADDEASGNILDDFIESDFDEYDMLTEFYQFIMVRDMNDYDF